MTKLSRREAAMQLITVSHLFFGFVFTAETSVSSWALQSFVTEPDIQPPVFDINKTGTTADVSVFVNEAVPSLSGHPARAPCLGNTIYRTSALRFGSLSCLLSFGKR